MWFKIFWKKVKKTKKKEVYFDEKKDGRPCPHRYCATPKKSKNFT